MQEIYRVKTSPVALSDNMIIGEKYRITFLTEALVRLEYSEDGVFEDRATQTVLFRDFPKTGYHVVRNADGIEVHTSMLLPCRTGTYILPLRQLLLPAC